MIKQILKKMVYALGYEIRNVQRCDQKPWMPHPGIIFKSRYPFLYSRFQEVLSELNGTKPNYVWGVLSGTDLAKVLGFQKISVLEFGVANGRGLISLEKIASCVEKIYGISIDVYGFDTGKGMPKPQDYRDLPNLWTEGYFSMDFNRLKNDLINAQLIIGDVKDTIQDFLNSAPAPIAFVAFDLDMYSSTMDAFRLFDAGSNLLLPRVNCHFDDILMYTFGDHVGERLAISDFNDSHKRRKISRIYGLEYLFGRRDSWTECAFLAHFFDHELYSKHDGLVTNLEPGEYNNKD